LAYVDNVKGYCL